MMAHYREVIRKDGRVAYEVRWRESGKERQATFNRRRDAERKVHSVEGALAKGETPEYRRRETVEQVVEKVMRGSEFENKRRTVANYREIYDRYVIPKFGKRRLSAITSEDVQEWIYEMSASGLAPATVRLNFVVFRKVFTYAIEHDLVAKDPCAKRRLPRRNGDDKPTAVRFLRPEQVRAVAAALKDYAPYDLLVRFAAATGLRASEIAGLRVSDVDIAGRRVSVAQAVQRIGGEWVTGDPKSGSGARTVPILDNALIRDLTVLLLRHPLSADPDALFWPGRQRGGQHEWEYGLSCGKHRRYGCDQCGTAGPVNIGSFYAQALKPALRKLGHAGFRFHDLRHTAASTWLAAGIAPMKVKEWMGHSSIKITHDVYGHLLPDDDFSNDAALYEAFAANTNR